jgi:hypothetical protein
MNQYSNDITKPARDFGNLVRDSLFSVIRGLGGISFSGFREAFAFALGGLVVVGFYYLAVNFIGSLAENPVPEPIVSRLSFLYLVLAGILCGAPTGFIRGLKRGVKKALLDNNNTYRLFEMVLTACFEQIDRVSPGAGNPVTELKQQIIEWTAKLRNLNEGSCPAGSRKLLTRIKSRLERIFIGRLADSLAAVEDEIEMYKLDYFDRKETVSNLTRLCHEKTDLALEKAIDRVFFKPLFFTYTLGFVFVFVPALAFLIF